MGKEEIKALIENHLSQKSNNIIIIHTLNLKKFPQITMNLNINKTANITLIGTINRNQMNMQYHLIGDSLKFNNLHLKEKIELRGSITGKFNALDVQGEGTIFGGTTNFNFIYSAKSIKDLNIQMKKIKSENILTLLDEKPFIQGRANIDAHFKLFSDYRKQGNATINMTQAHIPLLQSPTPFHLNTNIRFQNIEYDYNTTLSSKIGMLTITQGNYHQSKKELYGKYTLHINDLSNFETLLKHRYKGDFNTKGNLVYNEHNQKLHINGSTKKFDGIIEYVLKNNTIDFKLTAVSLAKVLEQFSEASLISSKIYGTINYNIEEQIAIINTDLKETCFLKSTFSNLIQEKLNTNILSEEYNKSSFSGGYKDSILFSLLKIDNGNNYIYLTDTKLNLVTHNIDSKFEMLMGGTKIQGKIYDTVENPQVKINTKMFTIYNEHLDSWLQGL